MKIIEPSYEIWDCPDGEAALAKIERIGRECYKSEDKIDDGYRPCPECEGKTYVVPIPDDPQFKRACNTCVGRGSTKQVEPSSHAFVRNILRIDRRAATTKSFMEKHKLIVSDDNDSWPGISLDDPEDCEKLVRAVVDHTLDTYRDDPPHDGLLEHCSVTVHFDVSRGFTHELVRHRHGSYAQESTRYCNYSKGKFDSSITVIKRSFEMEEQIDEWMLSVGADEASYMKLLAQGVKPEIARDLLPQALKSGITMTVNFNSLRNFFRKRCSPRAHPDMRHLMIPFRDEMRRRVPIVFEELI